MGVGGTTLGTEAFRWNEIDGIAGLGDLPGGDFYSHASDVSADGSVIVGFGNTVVNPTGPPGNEAFIWTAEDGMIGLGDLTGGPTANSEAYAVTADGTIVVGWSVGASGTGVEALVWDADNGMRNLEIVLTELGIDLTGWDLGPASDISADGRTIVGNGYNPSGENVVWIATIPEPTTALLLAIGLSGLAYAGRRND